MDNYMFCKAKSQHLLLIEELQSSFAVPCQSKETQLVPSTSSLSATHTGCMAGL